MQGSSPAIDEDEDDAKGGEEDDTDSGAPPPSADGASVSGPDEAAPARRNITQYRPYYSVFVPRTAARSIRARPRAAREPVRHCASLPSGDALLGALSLLERVCLPAAGLRWPGCCGVFWSVQRP